MKKIMLLVCFIGLIVSCKPKQNLVTTSVDRKTQVALKGSWTISSVTFPGSDYIKVTSFEVADAKCFEGSTWQLVSNNDTGTMALNKAGCPGYASDLKWYVTNEKQFVLKLLKEGDKPRKITQGYILTVENITENSFQLVDKVPVGNNSAKVVYQFNRN